MISITHMCKNWFFFLSLATATVLAGKHKTAGHVPGGGRGVFPRMDYDEWTPLGRGDPLKNDPTYDYVPPVLDRVNYWLEPEARTPDPPTSPSPPPHQVLLLGVSAPKKSPGKSESKKQPQADSRRDIFDPLIQLINERKHSVGRLRPQYIPLQGGYLYRTPPMRPPYTMLVPPPPAQRPTAPSTAPPTEDEAPVTLGTLGTSQSTTSPPVEPERTTFATPEATASTTHVHKILSPMTDIHTSGQQSLSSSFLQILLQNEVASTITTTPHPNLTTDPLFSHYKQPVEPLRGPMYLIIQGHSKVKTYGASKLDNISGIPIQDDNEVEYRRRRSRQIDLEDFLPVEETLEAIAKDYLDDDAVEGSGLKQLLAAAVGS